jgi:microcystin-dependent protein
VGEQYVGELRIFPFTFAPRGWALCNGQTLAINQNTALFSVIGTYFGGNGTTSFQLPNLQGRAPMHVAQGYDLGQTGGEVAHTLLLTEIPSHTHSANAVATAANIASPVGANLAEPVAHTTTNGNINVSAYGSGGLLIAMAPNAVANAGSSQAHNNMSPFLVLSVCISLTGIFPSRN